MVYMNCTSCKKVTESKLPLGLIKTNDGFVITGRCAQCGEFKNKKLSSVEETFIPDRIKNMMLLNTPYWNSIDNFNFMNIFPEYKSIGRGLIIVNNGGKFDLQDSLSKLPGTFWA